MTIPQTREASPHIFSNCFVGIILEGQRYLLPFVCMSSKTPVIASVAMINVRVNATQEISGSHLSLGSLAAGGYSTTRDSNLRKWSETLVLGNYRNDKQK